MLTALFPCDVAKLAASPRTVGTMPGEPGFREAKRQGVFYDWIQEVGKLALVKVPKGRWKTLHRRGAAEIVSTGEDSKKDLQVRAGERMETQRSPRFGR